MKNEEYVCMVKGCNSPGKLIGKIGSRPLVYCKRHEYYAEKVMDELIYSVSEKRKAEIKLKMRHKVFKGKEFEFCDVCGSKVFDLINEIVEKV